VIVYFFNAGNVFAASQPCGLNAARIIEDILRFSCRDDMAFA